jgi:hypothetical protein
MLTIEKYEKMRATIQSGDPTYANNRKIDN